jgi:hypothetical protein
VNFGRRIGTRLDVGAVRGMFSTLGLAHGQILTRRRTQSIMAPCSIGKEIWSQRFAGVQAAWLASSSSRTRLTIWPMLTGR